MSSPIENDPEFHDLLPKPTPNRRSRIVEILVILGILALLIALLLPFSRSSGPAVSRSWCTKNLKQIAQALHQYEQAYGTLPPAYTVDAQGRPLHSWRTLILPYLDGSPLHENTYKTIDLAKPWDDPANAKARETRLSIFRCPAAIGPTNTTTYLAIVAPNGCLVPGKPRSLAAITDPHNSTLMVIEADDAVPWMAPMDADEALVLGIAPTSALHHAGGMNACFVDGHVTFLKANTPASIRRALISISGNDNQFSNDW